MEYRSELVVLFLTELVTLTSIIILLSSIYTDSGGIEGISYKSFVAYYVTTVFVGFITYVDISRELGYNIKDGILSTYLLRPYNFMTQFLMQIFSQKTTRLSILAPIYLLLLIILINNLSVDSPGKTIFIGFFFAFIAMFMNYYMDLIISAMAFWVDDIWAFRHLKLVIFTILGGAGFPFELLSDQIRFIFELLPFKFLFYVPVSYILGTRDFNSYLINDLFMISFWIITFVLLKSLIWRVGITKYEAYGN